MQLKDASDAVKEPTEFLQFVDQVISTRISNETEDSELIELVKMCQCHSHTFICKKVLQQQIMLEKLMLYNREFKKGKLLKKQHQIHIVP